MQKKELLILILLACVNFTNIVDFMVIMPLAPQFEKAFQINPNQWSWVVSSYALSAFVSGMLCVFIIDKMDRKKFLLYSYLGFIIGTYICSLATSYNLLVSARVLTGFFGGLIGTVVLSIVGDVIPVKRRSLAMGIITTGFSVAASFGVPLGIYLADKYTWDTPFLVIAIFASCVWVLSYFAIPNVREHLKNQSTDKPFKILKEILIDKNRQRAFFFYSILIFGQFLVIPFLSPYLARNLGLDSAGLILMYAAGGICTIATAPVFGKLADKYGRKKVFKILLVISLFPVALITNLNTNITAYILIVTSSFFVFISGRRIPAISLVIATSPPETRGAFMSIRSALQQLAAGLASFVSGVIIIENSNGLYERYNWVGYISIIICFTTLFMLKKIKEVH